MAHSNAGDKPRVLRRKISLNAGTPPSEFDPSEPDSGLRARSAGFLDKPPGPIMSLLFSGSKGGTWASVLAHDNDAVTAWHPTTMDYDSSAFHFKKHAGLVSSVPEKCASFESMKWPGRYLRRWYDEVRVAGRGLNDPGFDADATFCIDSSNQYESYALRGRYLTNSYEQDVVTLSPPASNFGHNRIQEIIPIYLVSANGVTCREGQELCWHDFVGDCTGRPPLFSPPTSSELTVVFSNRTETHTVWSNLFTGLRPIIFLYSYNQSGYDYLWFKIEKRSYPCD